MLARLHNTKTPSERQRLLELLRSQDGLRGADLTHCDLSSANFAHTDLSGANFQHSDLSGANLTNAKFVHSGFRWANLSAACLEHTDFSGAYLWEVELTDAVFNSTNFSGASLIGTHFATTTWHHGIITLPDGTSWTNKMDMRRFSDPRHPDYETALAATNLLRLEWGVPLLGKHNAARRLYYPLPGERLSRDEMHARLQSRQV